MISDMELDKGMRTMTVIWAAMLFSLVVYLLLATQIGATVKTALTPDVLDLLRTIFYLLAVAILCATRFVRRSVLAGKGVANQKASPTLSHPLLQKYLAAMLIALALSESVGIFGFVLFLLGGQTVDLYLLIGLAAVAMLAYRPRKDELLALAQEEQLQAAIGGSLG